MKKCHVCILLTALVFGTPVRAGVDFSGTWKLDVARSDFGPQPIPDGASITIEQSDPTLTIKWMWSGDSGQIEGESRYSTDGTETKNVFGQMELTATAEWDGDKLKIHSTGYMGSGEARFEDVWELSAGGNTITVNRTMSSDMGEASQVLVWARE